MDNNLINLLKKYGRPITGALIGFLIGFFIINYGFSKTFLLAVCIAAGVFVANITKGINIRKLLIEILSKGEKE